MSNLEPLAKLSNLTQLTLDLRSNQVSDRPRLGPDLRSGQVSNLEPLSKLTRLQTLSIENATKAQRISLGKIPVRVVDLKF